MKKYLITAISLCILGTGTAHAAIQRSADFEEGQTVGVGLFGLSYDYGWDPVSLGLVIGTSQGYTFNFGSSNRLILGTRLLYRFMQKDGLSAGVIGGLRFDPGYPGSRANLIPDLGISIGYDFRSLDWPWALRLNVTLASYDDNTYYDGSEPIRSNFFQNLSAGPNTNLELAYIPTEDFEVTLGGGTLLGMRLKF